MVTGRADIDRDAAHALHGCYVISLRPAGGHATLRDAARARGARLLALSPWTLRHHDDAETRAALRAALRADCVVFTSPTAVDAAAALVTLTAKRDQVWLAVGDGTASALRRAGIGRVQSPQRMDSEGLLALPVLRDVAGLGVGLVTAPGGRDRIAATLARRGARVLRADVYERVPLQPSARALGALRTLDAPAWLALSSGGALEHVLAACPADVVRILRRARVVAASERLAALARAHGWRRIAVAASARPADLVAAAVAAMPPRRHAR